MEIAGNIGAERSSQVSNIRKEFVLAREKLNATKFVLPSQTSMDEMVDALSAYVAALSSAIQLESVGMSMEERQVVASAHFDAALLHLSSVLPIFNPSVAKTSLFYTPEAYSNKDVNNWRQDWLVKLAMAMEEDSAQALDFDNMDHYVLYDIFPLDLGSALYHLNKASLLGHTSSRSLFSLLSKVASRGLALSQPLPDSTFDKGLSSGTPRVDPTTKDAVDRAVETVFGVPTKDGDEGDLLGSSSSPSSKAKPSSSSSTTTTTSNSVQVKPRSAKMADWKVLEHVFQDLSAGGKSPSALLAEGYQNLHGVDTQQVHCPISKRVLREATAPLLELLKQKVPSPPLEFDEHALPVERLSEMATGQSMGSYKKSTQFDRMDLIDYYADLAHHSGQHQARNTMGSVYLYGTHGFKRSYSTAFKYFTEADRTRPSSQLGYMYHMGLGTPDGVDMHKALSQYSRAAAHNDSFALTQLGLIYLHGNAQAHVTADTRKAIAFLTKAAERDGLDANFHLGLLYRNGMSPYLSPDPARALKYTIYAATHGHLGALLELASLTGKCEDSVHLYMRVLNAALLQPVAARALEFYERGLYDHAAVLYNLMASLGHEIGQLNAAWLHERGLVSFHLSPLDLANLLPLNVPSLAKGPHGAATVSATHFKQSFDSLTSRLQTITLNGYYINEHGDSVKPYSDEVELWLEQLEDDVLELEASHKRHAFELYRLAAQQGSAEAQLKQGDFYYFGIGVPADYNRSAQFYLLASSLRHAQASFNLGYMYQRGLGVPVDLHLAKRYYDSAIAASSDAYLPSSLGLLSLHFQNLFFGSVVDPSEFSWDSTLLIILLIATIITITMKWRAR